MKENRFNHGIGHILLLVFIPVAIFIVYLFYKGSIIKSRVAETDDSSIITPTITQYLNASPTLALQREDANTVSRNNFSITFPEGVNINNTLTGATITIRTVNEIRNLYKDEKDSGGCPGACSTLIEGNNLENQFKILTDVDNLINCTLTDKVKMEINSFILFDGGPAAKDIIDTVWNGNIGKCGLKFIGPDGYDAWIGNYEYEAGFLVDDKVVEIRVALFPGGVFPEVDEMWSSFGFKDGFCDAKCEEKQIAYMKNIDLKSPMIQNIINSYDTAVKSLRLL